MDQSVKTSLKAMQIVYSALLAGAFIFLLVSIFLNQMAGPFLEGEGEMRQIFIIVCLLFGVGTIGAGIFIARKRLETIPGNLDTLGKLDLYRSVMIVRAALIEAAVFMFVVSNLLFADYIFSIGAFLSLGVMMIFFPTRSRIQMETGVEIRD